MSEKMLDSLPTCSAMSKFHEDHHITLEGTHLMYGGLCNQFWNVIVLRDPLARLSSHLSLLSETSSLPYWKADRVTPKFLFETVPVLSNNFYIRSLIGAKGYQLPYGNITEEHFEEAQRVLDSFDLVLMKTTSLRDDLYNFMGWDCDHQPAQEEKDAMPVAQAYFKTLTESWDLDEWQELRDANDQDIHLVQYARMLERVDKKVFRHPFFSFFAHQIQADTCAGGGSQCGYLCK